MSERRKWDKQSEFHPLSADGAAAAASTAAAVDASGDPVLEKQRQYIRMLEERNRLKKKLVAASKSQREREQLQEREEAFVTTFNVPKAASTSSGGGASSGVGAFGGGGGGHHHHGATVARKNKSAASLLPTRMAMPSGSANSAASLRPLNGAAERQSQCKSAPSTTLHSRQVASVGEPMGGRGESDQQWQRPARAKWSKPHGPMHIAVEDRDGQSHAYISDQTRDTADEKAHCDAKPSTRDDERSAAPKCSADSDDDESDGEKEKKKDSDSDNDDGSGDNDAEESYLDESFEDFDENDVREVSECEEIITADARCADDVYQETLTTPQPLMRGCAAASSTGNIVVPIASGAPANLSQTTTELFSIIQHLSRSKQKALTDVLQKFQRSEQRESDVKELRRSIGDPHMWTQLTATLFSSSETEDGSTVAERHAAPLEPVKAEVPSALALVLQEQKRWEDEYAQQMKARLVEERREKEKAMRAAEERRMAMMQQLEEEERELERLMELKRQERLAKLRALEQDVESVSDFLGSEAVLSVSKSTDHRPPASSVNVTSSGYDTRSTRARAGLDSLVGNEDMRRGTSVSPAKRSSKKKTKKNGSDDRDRARPRDLDGDIELLLSQDAPAKPVTDNKPDAKPAGPIVPLLNLGTVSVSRSMRGSEITSLVSSTPTEVRVKLLTAWGTTRAVGLAQINVYDANGDELEVDTASLKLYDESELQPLPKSHDMIRSLGRLFNGVAHTTSEQNMWLGRLSSSGTLRASVSLAHMNTWRLRSWLTILGRRVAGQLRGVLGSEQAVRLELQQRKRSLARYSRCS